MFERPFLRKLFLEGPIYRGKFVFQIDWASLLGGRKFAVFALFYFVFEGNFQVQAPEGAYIWRGLYMEGLIFGILWYACGFDTGFEVIYEPHFIT